MDSIGNLPDKQKNEFLRHVNTQQLENSILMSHNLLDSCFEKCVLTSWGGGFSTRNLTESEGACLDKCASKFLKLTQRAGFRYAEFQAANGANIPQQPPN